MLSFYLGQKARSLSHLERYAEAVETLKERLDIIRRIKNERKDAPEGYIDEQFANVYSVLAYCQQQTGAVAEARRSAAAFEQTRFSETEQGMSDILNYYALVGDAPNALKIYRHLEPLYRRQGDTINVYYRSMVQNLAEFYRKTGDFRRADLAMQRVLLLTDSISQRETQRQTAKFAQRYRTQEKELQLKDREAEARVYRITLVSIQIVLLLTGWYLWRFYIYNKVLTEKNRHLYEQIQQQERQEAERMQYLRSQPETVLTQNQQLYRRLCKLMDDEQFYIDENLNREVLAQQLGTNYKYVEQIIREYSNGETVTDFINRQRIQRVAQLLKTTDDSIGLICETCGIGSRPTLSRLFRDHYGMTPTEYRKISRR